MEVLPYCDEKSSSAYVFFQIVAGYENCKYCIYEYLTSYRSNKKVLSPTFFTHLTKKQMKSVVIPFFKEKLYPIKNTFTYSKYDLDLSSNYPITEVYFSVHSSLPLSLSRIDES